MVCTSRRDMVRTVADLGFIGLAFAIVWTPAYFIICALLEA